MNKILFSFLLVASGLSLNAAVMVKLTVNNQTEYNLDVYSRHLLAPKTLSMKDLAKEMGVVKSGESETFEISSFQRAGGGVPTYKAAVAFVMDGSVVGSLSFSEHHVGTGQFRSVLLNKNLQELISEKLASPMLKTENRVYKVNLDVQGNADNKFKGSSIVIKQDNGYGEMAKISGKEEMGIAKPALSKDERKAFRGAVRDGDLSMIEDYIKKFDVNSQYAGGSTMLMDVAVLFNQNEIDKRLDEKGSVLVEDINISDIDEKALSLVKLFVEYGADVKKQDEFGNDAAGLAKGAGFTETSTYLSKMK